MTKITTDFVGTESTVVTKSRLTEILAYWGASTAGYTTWGQARTDLNVRLLNTTAGVIGNEELAGSFLPKINFLNDPDAMILTALFGAGEQGVWFDPSDVANIDWRRNLLQWTEQFDNAAWTKIGATVIANSTTAPNGATTADLLTENTAGGAHDVEATPAATATTAYTVSAYFKRAVGVRDAYIQVNDNASGANGAVAAIFDLSSGASSVSVLVAGFTSVTANAVAVGSGWYRCSLSLTTVVGTTTLRIFQGIYNASRVYTGDGTSGVYAWGAQLELGSTATDYQPITNLNTEIIARFPDATMYQDFMGTTPVYAPNQPVGLRLDKSKGLVRTTVGTLPLDASPWFTYFAAVRTANTVTCSAAGQAIGVATVPGRWYRVTADVSALSGSFLYLAEGSGTSYGTVVSGVHTRVFNSTSTSMLIYSTSAGAVTYNSITVQEIAGNHAVQYTDVSRPLYGIEPAGGRRNLLTYTEDFRTTAQAGDTRPWVQTAVTPSTSTDPAPNGTLTASKIVPTTATSQHVVNSASFAAGTYTQTVYAKADGYNHLIMGSNQLANMYAWFNLATGETGTKQSEIATTSMTPVGNGWYRCQLVSNYGGSVTYRTFAVSNADNVFSFAGNGTSGILLWGAQLELNTAATPYQKVVSDYEITEAGVQTCHYCNYDGTNDGMVTNSINFTATDKMSVFAAVRKLGSTAGTIAELSANISSNNGSFLVLTEGAYYDFYGKGTSLAGRRATTYTAPIANTFSVIYDISQPTGATEIVPKVNGVTPTLTPLFGDMGTGNFGNYPLYIGRRGGASEPFNGRDYGIIISGKLATSTQIGNAENFLLNKLGSLAPVITGVPTIGVN